MDRIKTLNNALLHHVIRKQVEQNVKLDYILSYLAQKEGIDYDKIQKGITQDTNEALVDTLDFVNDIMDKIEDADLDTDFLDRFFGQSDDK